MDKKIINYITDQQDHTETETYETEETMELQQPITYDYIMSRLTRQFISQEVSNNTNQSQIHIPQKQLPVRASPYITPKANNKPNNERLPGYVKPYIGKPPTGELNTPVNKQLHPIVNGRQSIEKHIHELKSSNNINSEETKNKLLLLRKIALHNNKVMNDKIKSDRTQLKFQ